MLAVCPKMPNAANQGNPGNSKKPPINKETVDRFAQNMAEEIVQSLQMERADYWDFQRGQENMAKELASTVIGSALREVCRGQSKDVQKSPLLSQSGLPILGSLDYPDAPPTTPLLPELEKSRLSFTRKLKGGLAKEFLPSPPPPTPKEHDPGTYDPKVELLEHLMHSLTTDQSQKDYTKCCNNEEIDAYAEALSCDIMKCAKPMAQAIIKSTLDEANIRV